MINNWEQLEDLAADLIEEDNPIKPKNSGGIKGEEDVVGSSIIVQCKFTGKKNLSILKKDLDRLCNNANLLLKFPIFLNSNEADTVLSIPIKTNNDDLVKAIIKIIIIYQNIEILNNLSGTINSMNILQQFEKKTNNIQKIFKLLSQNINIKFGKLLNGFNTKRNSLTMYDLFEGEKDGT